VRDIIGKRNWFFAFSLVLIIPGVIFILLGPLTGGDAGLQFSIDYTGGTKWEIRFEDRSVSPDRVKAVLVAEGYGDSTVQTTSDDFLLIRTEPIGFVDTVALNTPAPSATPAPSGSPAASAAPSASPVPSGSPAPSASAAPSTSPAPTPVIATPGPSFPVSLSEMPSLKIVRSLSESELVLLDGEPSEPRVLIDPNTWSADGTIALAGLFVH
jgi:hypothetical protein